MKFLITRGDDKIEIKVSDNDIGMTLNEAKEKVQDVLAVQLMLLSTNLKFLRLLTEEHFTKSEHFTLHL